MIARLLVVGLVLGHGLVHAAYLAPRPPVTAGGPAWPFELGYARLLDAMGLAGEASRLIGLALVAVAIGGFALAAVAALGVAPSVVWAAGIVVGAFASLALLVLFFHPWLAFGMVIDLILLWAVLVAGWAPDSLTP